MSTREEIEREVRQLLGDVPDKEFSTLDVKKTAAAMVEVARSEHGSDRYRDALVAEVSHTIRELPSDAVPTHLDVSTVARTMVDAVPQRSKYDEFAGPFYETSGVRAVLRVSRQAVKQRSDRGGLLRVVTREGKSLYPTFQFDQGEVRPEVSALLKEMADVPDPNGWIRAAWFGTPTEELNGMTPRAVATADSAWATFGQVAIAHARECALRWSQVA